MQATHNTSLCRTSVVNTVRYAHSSNCNQRECNDDGDSSSSNNTTTTDHDGYAILSRQKAAGIHGTANFGRQLWTVIGCGLLLGALVIVASHDKGVPSQQQQMTKSEYGTGTKSSRPKTLVRERNHGTPVHLTVADADQTTVAPSPTPRWPATQRDTFVQYDKSAYFDPSTLGFSTLGLKGAARPVRLFTDSVVAPVARTAAAQHDSSRPTTNLHPDPNVLKLAFNPAVVKIPAGPLHLAVKSIHPEAHFVAAVRVKGKQSRKLILGAASSVKIFKPPHQRLTPTTAVLLLDRSLATIAEIPLKITPLIVVHPNDAGNPPPASTTLSASDVRLELRGSKVIAIFMSDVSHTVNFAELTFQTASKKRADGDGDDEKTGKDGRAAGPGLSTGLAASFVPLKHPHIPATSVETRGRNFALLWPKAWAEARTHEFNAAPLLMCWMRERPLLVPLNGSKGDQYCPWSPAPEIVAEQGQSEGQRREQLEALRGLEGSTMHNNVEVHLPRSQGLLGVAHTHSPYESQKGKEEAPAVKVSKYGGTYATYFVLMDPEPPFRVRSQSPPFCIPSARNPKLCETIQFVSSIGMWSPTELLIGYGINDCEAAMIKLNLIEVLAFTRSDTESKHAPITPQSVPREQPNQV